MRILASLTLIVSSAAGCGSVWMSAQWARAPVTFGPVACIDCAATAPLPLPAPRERIRDSAIRARTEGGENVSAAHTSSRGHQLDSKVNAAVPDPCRGEVRLSKVTATSFGSLFRSSLGVHVEGAPEEVPGGTCAPAVAVPPPAASTPQ
jgi:hypothetical protein